MIGRLIWGTLICANRRADYAAGRRVPIGTGTTRQKQLVTSEKRLVALLLRGLVVEIG